MAVIWNEGGAYLSPFRTVLRQQAPRALDRLDEHTAGQIGQGNYIVGPYDENLLALLTAAYQEARTASNYTAASDT